MARILASTKHYGPFSFTHFAYTTSHCAKRSRIRIHLPLVKQNWMRGEMPPKNKLATVEMDCNLLKSTAKIEFCYVFSANLFDFIVN